MRILALVFVLPCFSDSIRWIEVQNKIAGFQELRRLTFVVPEGMAQRLAQEQEDALSSVRGGMKEGLAPVDTALADLTRANEEKNKEARKLLQKAAEKIFKDTHKVDEIMAKWDAAFVNREVAINQAFLGLARDIESKGEMHYVRTFYSRVAMTYGGPKANAIVTHAELSKMFAQLEEQREGLRARLEVLSRLKKWMDAYEFLKDPQDWLVKQVDKYAVEFLASGYNEESRKTLTGIFTSIRENVVATAAQWQKIDQSIANVPESTRKMCKAFAVAGGMIKTILGALKELKVAGPFEAAFTAIGYYVDAFDVIWKSAEVLAKIFDKQRQNQVTEADWGLESKLAREKGNNGVLDRDADAAAFGMPILTNGREWFLLMNDTEYETLTKEQRDRAVQAMADERIQNGFYEASEGWGSWVGQKISNAWEYLWSAGQADLRESERKAHEQRLLAVSRKTLIDRKSLAAMARGTDGYFSLLGARKSVSCEKLAEMREEFLEKLGRDFFIRDAMGAAATKPEWRKAYTDFWIAFTKADVAFSREQLGRLFRGFVENPDAAKLEKALKREEERRKLADLEVAIVWIGPDEFPAGQSVALETDFAIDGLPAGEEFEATVTWKGPAWASGSQKVKIRNGVVAAKLAVSVPADAEMKANDVEIRFEAAPFVLDGKGAVTVTKKALSIRFGGWKDDFFVSGETLTFGVRLNIDDAFLFDEKAMEDWKGYSDQLKAYQLKRKEMLGKVDRKAWVHFEVIAGGKTHHVYSRVGGNEDKSALAGFRMSVRLWKPGSHTVTIRAQFLGETVTVSREAVVPPFPGEAQRRKNIEELKAKYEKEKAKEKASPSELVRLVAEVAYQHDLLNEYPEAIEWYRKGVEAAYDPPKPSSSERTSDTCRMWIAHHYLEMGEFEKSVAMAEKMKQPVRWADYARGAVRWKNDLGLAWSYAAKVGPDGWEFPKTGDPIVK